MKNKIKRLLREGLNKEFDFNRGDCDLYAVALHRLYGLPLYTVRNYYDNGSGINPNDKDYEMYGIDAEDAHIVVKSPNGKYLDDDGEWDAQDLIKQCIFAEKIGEIKIVPIDEDEALSIFGGCDYEIDDKLGDINSIKDYIRSKK